MGQRNSTPASKTLGDSGSGDEVKFTINGIPFAVGSSTPPGMTLNTFIREIAKLPGTKAMCHEGGCGVCIVAAEKGGKTMAVNSCLVSVFTCNGWSIRTIEGIGNRKKGYHTIQATLAELNGTQCGFCSPGMVMNMYSLLQNDRVTMKDVENSFAGNICRCTGYRPILDAFKSLANDADPKRKQEIDDIEELYNIKKCTNCLKIDQCKGHCNEDYVMIKPVEETKDLHIKFNGTEFFKVRSIEEIFKIFSENSSKSYVLYGGNTAHGVYRQELPNMLIDINDVPDLLRIDKEEDALVFGGSVTLTALKKACEKYSVEKGFEYLADLAKHIDLVASIPVKNIGTIAGNLMIKYQHREFQSDIFLIFETAGVQIHILTSPSEKKSTNLLEFLDIDMNHKLIYSVVLPSLTKNTVYKSYKIMPRAQNAHAIVNAGFLFELDLDTTKVLQKPNIIFGGINSKFFHATSTEDFLVGKILLDNKTLQDAFKLLDKEISPDRVLPDPSPEFRKSLAINLFYKFVLSLKPDTINPKFRSGGNLLERELSSGSQNYDTNRDNWPVSQPVTKLEALSQTSGEAEYVNDIQVQKKEVFCAFTLADRIGTFKKIDCSEALKIDGVVAFYSSKDVTGKNAFVNSDLEFDDFGEDEILLADGKNSYAGQPYGIIAATSQAVALKAASKVTIVYSGNSIKEKPLIRVQDVIAAKDKYRIKNTATIPAKTPPGKNVDHVITGTFECESQYHFSMETQSCVCHPTEDGINVYSSTQWMDFTQSNIASVLNVPVNSINMQVRRLGGAYGSKISRATQIACACALVCHKLNRPARMILSLEDNMNCIGKRVGAYFNYNLGVDKNGVIQYQNINYWGNKGCSFNESHGPVVMFYLPNCYDISTWNLTAYEVKTDLPGNTWCRSPGSAEGISAAENIMEHIAAVTGQSTLDVRLNNMIGDDEKILVSMIDKLKDTSNYVKRADFVETFNEANRWKKRGISLVPMKYPVYLTGQYHAMVSIYSRDGSVAVCHAGIEMGQGINTKMAQIAAHTLGVDLKKVIVKPSNSLTAPNSWVTGGSVGSDTCGYAVMMACKELNKRLDPIRQSMEGKSWTDVVRMAYKKDIDLCASFMYIEANKDVKSYNAYGVTVAEVEVDILTGQYLLLRVDILEDMGQSLSPKIDVGQVEGAFVMGMGFSTFEEIIYDPESGRLTNHRTWNYKVPGAKDIPVDFNISFHHTQPESSSGVARSKTAGEPPLAMSCAIPIAIRKALNSSRKDTGSNEPWYQLDVPVTTEKILLSSLTKIENMTI